MLSLHNIGCWDCLLFNLKMTRRQLRQQKRKERRANRQGRGGKRQRAGRRQKTNRRLGGRGSAKNNLRTRNSRRGKQ